MLQSQRPLLQHDMFNIYLTNTDKLYFFALLESSRLIFASFKFLLTTAKIRPKCSILPG